MSKRTHVRRHKPHSSSEEGFISENIKQSMNNNEKIIMGVLAGGIILFLALSILILFGRDRTTTPGGEPRTTTLTGTPVKQVLTPYPTIPPVENMTVLLSQRRFTPQSFAIPAGGTVSFLNASNDPISIEANDGNSALLNLGTLNPGEFKNVVLSAKGTYTYRNKEKTTQIGVITIQ